MIVSHFLKKRLSILATFFLAGLALHGQEIRSVKITEVEKIIEESNTPVIVNMWATWCKPCIEEIPYFIKEVDKYNAKAGSRGDSIRLLLVSLDFKEAFPDEISAFARERKYNVPIVWLNETNADYFCPKIDPKWSGAIPATLFINKKTGYRNFFEKQLSHMELKQEIMAMLQTN